MKTTKRAASLFLALTLAMGLTVPALAAEDVTVSDTNSSGQSASFVVQGVEGKESLVVGDSGIPTGFGGGYAPGTGVEVLVVKPETVIDVAGNSQVTCDFVALRDGKLYSDYRIEGFGVDYTWELKQNEDSTLLLPGSSVTLLTEGCYLITATGASESSLAFTIAIIHVSNDLGALDLQPVDAAAPEEPAAPAGAAGSFTDVDAASPYAGAVKWAVEQNITAGKTATTFAPGELCTNAQILTFLWRAKGEPAPTGSNPFADVSEGDYYYKAALWAYESGMVSGSDLHSAAPCTRSQTVTYLWELAGKPAAAKAGAFTDVAGDADYAQAVAWAVEQGITTGTSETTFAPDATCTRGQIVTFLYRDLG